uniref:RING-type domain-containing protein n=1 Tax=Craspedostauros australis TaxID=1486917 RepID=A0A7R9WLD9_9STRA|mmetsp:Transcript_1052/g.3068  ORF Transcript_1052/g.3068 Transcript_1052/m.3068 type:complete len:197 (+) Transcript_1052:3-593(+)
MRKLPCDHTFHANCIARWLVERSATCPLCKIDLFEDEEEPEETGQDAPTTNGAAQATAGAATTDMYVPAWLARRLAMVEQQAPNQQQESPSWWQRTFSRTSAPRGATAAAAASAETITETVPSAEATTTTTPAAAATTEVEPSSWFGRIFFPTAGTQPGPALTELTEPLLQNEGEALPADPQAEEMPGLTPTQAEV